MSPCKPPFVDLYKLVTVDNVKENFVSNGKGGWPQVGGDTIEIYNHLYSLLFFIRYLASALRFNLRGCSLPVFVY